MPDCWEHVVQDSCSPRYWDTPPVPATLFQCPRNAVPVLVCRVFHLFSVADRRLVSKLILVLPQC